MKQKKLVLCDPEMDYAQQLAAFLEKDKDFPWEVVVYSVPGEAKAFLNNEPAEILLLAESLAEEGLSGFAAEQIVLLNESGEVRFPQVRHINKYQEAENVRRELLGVYVQQERAVYPSLQVGTEARMIAMYSPVRRCLQTGFAVAYGQLLAEHSKVLYLHLGYYAGRLQLEAEEQETELGALMYYLRSGQNKFSIHMKSMLRSMGNWDYVPSMRNAVNLSEIKGEDWLELIRRCKSMGEYDYIVLDLCDGLQGLFDILRQCDRIITIGKSDAVSRRKQENYDYVLECSGYQDIQQKTWYLNMPVFDRLPEALEEYSRGELAEYVKKFIREYAV